MTKEEKQKAIDALKISAPVMAVTQEEFNDYIECLNKIMDWLEQEPKYCDRNICLRNEYSNIGCDECEVTKSQEPCEVEAAKLQQAYNKGFEDCRQALLDTFGLSEKTHKWGGDHSGYNTMMLYEIQDVIESQPPVNPQEPKTDSDAISRQAVECKLKALVNEMETIFADIREKNVDDSVCGLCEYDCDHGIDGYANECPGFERDDCFKLKDEYRKEWKNIKDLPSVKPQEPKKCKDCKWWRDSDGAYRRGVKAESKCPINTVSVANGWGYCYMFEPQESEVRNDRCL